MSTRYPASLPKIDLPGRWGIAHLDNGGDFDEGTAYSRHTVMADSQEQAEKRVLSVIAYDYSDMRQSGYLEGCIAIASPTSSRTTWAVTINYRRTS